MKITLDSSKSFADQLKSLREAKGISLTTMAEKLNLAPSNVYHFETQNKTNGKKNPFRSIKNNLSENGMKYAKALGATKIEIIL